MIFAQSVKIGMKSDLESEAFHVVFVSDSVSFGCSSPLHTRPQQPT